MFPTKAHALVNFSSFIVFEFNCEVEPHISYIEKTRSHLDIKVKNRLKTLTHFFWRSLNVYLPAISNRFEYWLDYIKYCTSASSVNLRIKAFRIHFKTKISNYTYCFMILSFFYILNKLISRSLHLSASTGLQLKWPRRPHCPFSGRT